MASPPPRACTYLFGPHPIVVFGTDEQKARWVPRLVAGEDKCCFGVTEPDAGLNTTRIKTFAEKVDGGYRVNGQKMWTSTGQVASNIMLLARTTRFEDCARPTDGISIFYTDVDRDKIEIRRIPKMGRKAVDSNAVFIDQLFIPDEDLIGEEGRGFSYILHSLNPLAENWMSLEAAYTIARKAAWLSDNDRPCGAEANAAKYLGAKAGHDACLQAVLTHGGMGYAKEYHAERLLREVTLTRIAPVSEQLIKSFIAEKVLELPQSY